jgi:hypothetical protein
VFTARYALSPYIKQIHFAFKGLICTFKYPDGLELLAKEETVLRGMVDRLIETGRYCRMEMNVEKTKTMRI